MTALLDVAVRSSLILVVGIALMPALRQQSAALRHWVLFTFLAGAAVVPLAMWAMPAWELPAVSSLVPDPLAERVATFSQRASLDPRAAVAPVSGVAAPARSSAAWQALLLPLWLLGAALSLATLAIGVLRLQHINRTAAPVVEGPWSSGSHPAAAVRVTGRRGLLVVWGIRRPTIIVPAAALSWSRDRIHWVLQHELAHVRRRDWPLLITSEIVRAIYWFNPLVWVICARLRTESEIACDDIVIADGGAGAEYASHVVETARELRIQHWLPAPAIVRPSTLERRVRAMLDNSRNRRPVSSRARRTIVVFSMGITLTLAGLAAQSFVSLSGTIVDASNGVLPGVKLILVNQQTRAKYEIQTDKTGRYEFVGLPPGTYTMEAALPGFSRFSGRVIVGAQNLQQDLTMSVGTIQETITVTSGAPATRRVVTANPDVMRKLEERRARAAAACASPLTVEGVPIGGNIRVPVKLRDVRPLYPATLQTVDGLVVLHAKIGADGAVTDIEAVSSTHEEFTQSAIEAVRQWEFDATWLNCEPIVTPMQVTVNYTVK
jgi:TonB family protein